MAVNCDGAFRLSCPICNSRERQPQRRARDDYESVIAECAKHQMAHCQECAEACKRCADECRRMAGARATKPSTITGKHAH